MAQPSLMPSKGEAIKAPWGNGSDTHVQLSRDSCFVCSFLVHIDENGDAAGNYTILGTKLMNSANSNQSTFGLFPFGTFITSTTVGDDTNNNNQSIPVRRMAPHSSPSSFFAHFSLSSRSQEEFNKTENPKGKLLRVTRKARKLLCWQMEIVFS